MIFKSKVIGLGFVIFVGVGSAAQVNASSNLSSEGGVVTDSATALQWQDSYENNGGVVKSGSFIEAKQYCSELRLADQSGWRIPSKDELLSIVDQSRVSQDQPAIQKAFEKVMTEEAYLSDTHYEDDDESVWIVDFYHGESDDVALIDSDGYHIRCVRTD